MSHNGNRYVMSWMCPTSNDRSVTFHDVLTVASSGSYQDSSEAHQEQQVVHSEINAIRLGNCADRSGAKPARQVPFKE
jgi:hypothetical protein